MVIFLLTSIVKSWDMVGTDHVNGDVEGDTNVVVAGTPKQEVQWDTLPSSVSKEEGAFLPVLRPGIWRG